LSSRIGTQKDAGWRSPTRDQLFNHPVESVAAALRDPDPSVRLRALILLGNMAETDPQARAALERVASQDADKKVRETAKGMLEDLGGQASN